MTKHLQTKLLHFATYFKQVILVTFLYVMSELDDFYDTHNAGGTEVLNKS